MSEPDMISKIGARQSTRNDERKTRQPVPTTEDGRCEQEVAGQKVPHDTRPDPVAVYTHRSYTVGTG